MEYVVASAPEVAVTVHSAGLACCAVEVAAAVTRGLLVPAADSAADVLGGVQVFVVAGTLTHAMAPALRTAWEELPDPKAVLSFGACANSGGPYWDSYSVVAGIDSMIPVMSYVAGCPPHPEALVAAILDLAGRVRASAGSGGAA